MSDVSKIQGPSGAPESSDKKNTSVDAEKFAEARKRVEKVSQIDPDEQKKRKRQEEVEEEELLPPPPAETPPSQIPPFLLTQEPRKAGLLDLQQGNSSTSFPTPLNLSSSQEDYTSFFSEETSSTEKQSPSTEQTSPTYSQNPQPSTPSSQNPPAYQQTSLPSSSPSSQTPSTSKTKTISSKSHSTEIPLKQPLELNSHKKPSEDTTSFFKQLKPNSLEPETTKTPQEEPSPISQGSLPETSEETLIEGGAIQPPSPLVDLHDKSKMDKKISSEAILQGGALTDLQGEAPPLIKPAEEVAPLTSYAHLTPQIQEMFDKMVGVMTVMNLSGMTETSFTLNASKFASSVFFGAQIIIREFSTAPQAFNVQLNGSMQAVALFQANADDLMAAFQAGNYNFRINRLDTNYLSTERPLFKRKEGDNGQGQDKGGQPQ